MDALRAAIEDLWAKQPASLLPDSLLPPAGECVQQPPTL